MIGHKAPAVLVVEDEGIVAADLQQTLDGLGYDAFAVAASAEEALARAAEKTPDLVLMDIRIKGHKDGIATAELLRARFDVPVVYITAHADDATLERAKNTQPAGYLLKPIKSAELRSVIEVGLHRHKSEKELRERERLFSTTLKSFTDAVVMVDLLGQVTFMNASAEMLTGRRAAEVAGLPAAEVIQLFDSQGQSVTETLLHQALAAGRAQGREEAGLANQTTGQIQTITDATAPIVDAGQTLGAVMVFRDTTLERRTQQKVELADRLASLWTMAAGIAHEVNNPLCVVLANTAFVANELEEYRAQAASEALLTPERLDGLLSALKDALSASFRIGRVVKDLESFSSEGGRSSSGIDLAKCVGWAVRTTARYFDNRARVTTRIEEPRPLAMGDEARLGQVLLGLLGNAARMIEPGNPADNRVSVEVRRSERNRAVIEISDTGVGMSKEMAARIFEPFFALGAGLGLSMGYAAVTAMGGEIEVESEPSHGTTFRILLPLAAISTHAVSVSDKKSHPRLSGRILVVDDEPPILKAISRTLKEHDVTCVASAGDALALLLAGQTFDLIITDLMMPGMTGMEFYETLMTKTPDIAKRVVFMSGGATRHDIRSFLAMVSNPHLEKPFDVTRLLEVVQELLFSH